MGAKALISPAEYLAMHFAEREPEYVHGELKEKALPDSFHSEIRALLVLLLGGLRRIADLRIRTEVRCEVAPDVYRLPDVALFHGAPFEQIPSTPALMVAEIVSKDDRQVDLIAKLRDYAVWGVPNIWIIDPWSRRLAVWRNDTEVPVEALSLPEYGLEVRLEQLIEGLPL
jgi:Uma2 family endonuclease